MSNTTKNPYKVIITGILTQQTAFSIGGNASGGNTIDMPLAKDGKGRYTIRGNGLAGALIATARQLYETADLKWISEGSPQQQLDQNLEYRLNESVWIFHHAHPVNTPKGPPEIRDNVAIRQKTGAAKHGAKFDTEILPAGTQWHFLMEVDEYRDQDKTATTIALHALAQWQQRCWLGRAVARGLGWMQLDEMQVFRLTSEQVSHWPNAFCKPLESIKSLEKENFKLSPCEIQKIKNIKNPPNKPETLSGTITITIGEAGTNSYGVDFLSVGGNNKAQDGKNRAIQKGFTGKQFEDKRYLKPLGQNPNTYFEFKRDDVAKPPDFSLAVTQQDGKIVPHIPGSSIRGVLRHSLSWLRRNQGCTIWEPGGENDYPDAATEKEDIVLQLFGSTQRSAALLISDALPKKDAWQALILEMHAEDEFTQGVYGEAKFNHTCLVKGQFAAHYHLTLDNKLTKEVAKATIEILQKLAALRMLPLGSGQWQGLGWVQWEISINADNNEKNQES